MREEEMLHMQMMLTNGTGNQELRGESCKVKDSEIETISQYYLAFRVSSATKIRATFVNFSRKQLTTFFNVFRVDTDKYE